VKALPKVGMMVLYVERRRSHPGVRERAEKQYSPKKPTMGEGEHHSELPKMFAPGWRENGREQAYAGENTEPMPHASLKMFAEDRLQ
jgi:hypothetical protein